MSCGQLRHEDQDGERIDEARDHRSRDELHQQVEPRQSGGNLDDAHQDRGGEQVFHAMVAHERDHQDGDGRRRGRDHARPPAGEGDHDRDRDRGVKPDARIDAGDDREADRFGDQRERDDDAGEDVGTEFESQSRRSVAKDSFESPGSINGACAGLSRG